MGGKSEEGWQKLKSILWIFLGNPENVGGVAGYRWDGRVKEGW